MMFQRFPLVFVTLSLCLSVLSAPIPGSADAFDATEGVHSLATTYQADTIPFYNTLSDARPPYDNTNAVIKRTTSTTAAAPAVTSGSSITINGHAVTLGKEYKSTDTPVFEINWKGQEAFAKTHTIYMTAATFEKEIENTKKASAAFENGLFIESGTYNNAKWMILKKLSGQPLADVLFPKGGLKRTMAACKELITKASNLAADAQMNLGTKANIFQEDTNNFNYLFDAGLTRVNMIDFGTTLPVTIPTNRAAAMRQSQLKQFQDTVFAPVLEYGIYSKMCT